MNTIEHDKDRGKKKIMRKSKSAKSGNERSRETKKETKNILKTKIHAHLYVLYFEDKQPVEKTKANSSSG